MSRFSPLRREGDVKELAHVGAQEDEKKWRRMSSLARLDPPRLLRPLDAAGAVTKAPDTGSSIIFEPTS